MAGDLLSTLTNFHQTHYRDVANSDVPRASDAATMLFTKAKRISLGGTSLATTWEHELGEGVGSSVISEAGDYPAAGYDSAINPTLPAVTLAFSVRWSYHALNAGKSTRYDNKSLIKKKGMALTDQAKKTLARYFMWNGNDILGQTAAASGTTNGYFTLASGACPIHFFEVGQVVNFYDGATSGSSVLTNAATGGGRIVAIDPDLGRIYIADATGLTGGGGDYIAWQGHYDLGVPNGLRTLVDSGDTVQGITRSAAAGAVWRCIEIDRGSASLTSSDWDELRDRVMDQAYLRDGNYTTTVIGNRKMRRWLIDVAKGQVRFASLADIGIGASKVALQGTNGEKAMLEDEYIIDGELYAVTWDKFVLGTPEGTDDNGMQPVMNGSSPLFQATASSGDGYSDSQLQYLRWCGNLGIDGARCMGKMVNLAAP